MKQILKKVAALCTVAACSAMVITGSVACFADEANQEFVNYINSNIGTVTERIISFSDEEIADLKESKEELDVMLADTWSAAKEEVGEYNELGEISVTYDDNMYSAIVPVDFETYDANFVYIFSEEEVLTSVTIDIQYPLSVNMKRAGMNTLMGLGTVFCVLVFLMCIISLFKFIGGGKKKSAPAAAPAAPAPAPVVEEEYVDDTELIAVIAAAIAASEGAASTDGFVVRSIRKVNRKVR